MASLLKKITVKTVYGGKPDLEKLIKKQEELDKRLPLMEVIGIANGYKNGSSVLPDGKTSNWTKLTGQFKAVNLDTGEVFRSGVAIMPAVANDLVVGVLSGGTINAVEFGFRVYAVYVKDR